MTLMFNHIRSPPCDTIVQGLWLSSILTSRLPPSTFKSEKLSFFLYNFPNPVLYGFFFIVLSDCDYQVSSHQDYLHPLLNLRYSFFFVQLSQFLCFLCFFVLSDKLSLSSYNSHNPGDSFLVFIQSPKAAYVIPATCCRQPGPPESTT